MGVYQEKSIHNPVRIFKLSNDLGFGGDYLFKKSNDTWDTLLVLPEAMNQSYFNKSKSAIFLSDQAVYKMTEGVIVPLIKDRTNQAMILS